MDGAFVNYDKEVDHWKNMIHYYLLGWLIVLFALIDGVLWSRAVSNCRCLNESRITVRCGKITCLSLRQFSKPLQCNCTRGLCCTLNQFMVLSERCGIFARFYSCKSLKDEGMRVSYVEYFRHMIRLAPLTFLYVAVRHMMRIWAQPKKNVADVNWVDFLAAIPRKQHLNDKYGNWRWITNWNYFV